MAANNIRVSTIRFSRDSVIEESSSIALLKLQKFQHVIGQPVMVRYYSNLARTKIDTMIAVGIKNGTGLDAFQVLSAHNKSLIHGIVDSLPDVSKLVHGEVYIYMKPSEEGDGQQVPYYVRAIKDSTGEAVFGETDRYKRVVYEINDGPRLYEDLSTGRSIYIGLDSSVVVSEESYTKEELDEALDTKINKNQGSENAGKVLRVGEDGELILSDIDEGAFYTAGENIEISEDNVISAPNVVSQYSTLPSPEGNEGKVVQYVGPTTDKLINYRFYKSDGNGWNVVSIQENFTNIITLDRKEFAQLKEKDPDTIYFITDDDWEGQEMNDAEDSVYVFLIWADIMPEASFDNLNDSYIYTGDEEGEFIRGHVYKCKETSLGNYEWIDLSERKTTEITYQNISPGNVNATNKYISTASYETVAEMFEKIQFMKSFNGALIINNFPCPIVRLNGIKETSALTDSIEYRIQITVIPTSTLIPTVYQIIATNKGVTMPTNFRMYLTILS